MHLKLISPLISLKLPIKEKGFALPTAIFLLVVLTALASYILYLSDSSSQSNSLDIQGARAYQAASAGLEWAAYQTRRNMLFGCSDPGASTTYTPVLTGQLAQFNVTVTCTRTSDYEGATPVVIDTYTSNANNLMTACGGTAHCTNYVERELRMVIGAP